MKKSLLIVLALVAIYIMSSCKRYASEIAFGDTAGMRVATYDSTDLQTSNGQFPYSEYYDIDLNNDGWPEIQLLSVYEGSHEVGRSLVSYIKCQNENVALLGDIILQEHYLHVEETFEQVGEFTYHITTLTHTCERIDESDEIESTEEKLSIWAMNAGETFGVENDFMSTDVTLKDFSYSWSSIDWPDEDSTNVVTEIPATVAVYDTDHCDSFPLNQEKYIGFKHTINGRDHLGWMKIILEYRNGEYYVKPIESAIQK